jgi:hypothetical protein
MSFTAHGAAGSGSVPVEAAPDPAGPTPSWRMKVSKQHSRKHRIGTSLSLAQFGLSIWEGSAKRSFYLIE